jgi:hypothetical protein
MNASNNSMMIFFPQKLKKYFCFAIVLILTYGQVSMPLASAQAVNLGLSDEELLETISESAFGFFKSEFNPQTGLIRDRAHNFRKGATNAAASVAAVGFGLTAYGIAVERGWMSYSDALARTKRTLQFMLNDAPQEHGFFYHFLDMRSGQRSQGSELSPIDTALFLGGALFAGHYFADDPEVALLAQQIYERVDWQWMTRGRETIAMAWSPEKGFEKRSWDHYDESMIMYLLAIGSPTHPLPADVWKKISRPVGSYGGHHVIQMPPLFTHQYSHAWIDFRDKNDGFADYFQNSINATLANRQFCIDQSSQQKTYGPNAWGLTASDGPFGYRAFGAPPGWADHDGTLAPTGCGGSIVFTPELSIACLRHFYEEVGKPLWGMYGFSDSYNLTRNWFDEEVIGIDQGTLLLMIENYRSGLIWKVMSKDQNLKRAMDAVGFRPGTKAVPFPDPPQYVAPYIAEGIKVDGYLRDWSNPKAVRLDIHENKEVGNFTDAKDLSAQARFAWSREALYFSIIVDDDSLILNRQGKAIWQDDLVEIYVDPEADGLRWENRKDFQIGFSPHKEDDGINVWSWFQPGIKDFSPYIAAKGFAHESGYVIEGGIRWSFLGVDPRAIDKLKLSIAVHDIDADRSEGKLHWFFRNEDELKRFNLGDIILERTN